jgi:hypothetical protein
MRGSQKGISTRQIQRILRCSMKTAWHLTHRIRLAMSDSIEAGPLDGAGKVVEPDETYFGNLPPHKAPIHMTSNRPKFGPSRKRAIDAVNHGQKECAPGDVTTNTIETSRCSSAACVASISSATRSTCIVTLRNLISALTPARLLASTTSSAPRARSWAERG